MFNGLEHLVGPKLKFAGMYMAEVINGEDPVSSSSGRVKVRVFPMMTGLDVAVLPWALPAFGLFEGGSVDAGAFTVPAAGSKVWVFFAAGDVRSPVYFAAALGMSDGPAGAGPEKKIWKSRSGHTITVSDKSGEEVVSIETAAAHKVTLDDDGNTVTVEHKDGQKIVLTGSAVQLGSGTLKNLINDLFKTLYDGHKHGYIPNGSSTPALTTVPSQNPIGTPPDPITAAMVTTDTEAS